MLSSTPRVRAVIRRYAHPSISDAAGNNWWPLSSWKPPVTASAETCPDSVSSWMVALNLHTRNSSLSRYSTGPCYWLQKIDPQEAPCAVSYHRHVHKLSAKAERPSEERVHDEKERSKPPSRTTGKSGPGTMAKSLVQIVMSLSHVKEEVYGALDKWAAFELKFPLEATMNALKKLRDKNQWHRVIQVSKWMLSKGIGKTNGTYSIMLKAYCMDGRLDDAEALWEKVIALNNRSTPKNMFSYMIHIYRKHDMPEKTIQVFEQMESFGIKPDIDILRRVRDAYHQLGKQEKQDELTKKYPLNSKQRRNERRIAARTASKTAKIHDENDLGFDDDEPVGVTLVRARQASMNNEQLNLDNEPQSYETIKFEMRNKISSSSKEKVGTAQIAIQSSPGTHKQQTKAEERISSDGDLDFVEKVIATM